MESSADIAPLVVLVGPTASGKSRIALQLAEKFNGEIISADSRAIYKHLDIGTAKPTLDQLQKVPHHLIDIVEPDQPFTAADFKQAANEAIADVASRGKLPILVGGTGLYVDSVIFDYTFLPPGDAQERERLSRLSVEALQQLLKARGIPLPLNEHNPRHLIRRLEAGYIPTEPRQLRANTVVIGIEVEPDELKQRIAIRVDAMFAQGLAHEATSMGERYGWQVQALQTIGYREFRAYAEGTQSLTETHDQIVQDTISYAKRQRTWFKRNKSIQWGRNRENIEDIITTFLSK